VFLDECGFLLIPNVRRTWAPRGHTPIIRHRYRRDKVSAISAVTVSARRRRCGLYIHFYPGSNITHVEVAVFLRAVLRQLRGHVIVLWDGGRIHKGPDVRALLSRCPRLHVEPFPGYAPDLNPDEFVWTHFKALYQVSSVRSPCSTAPLVCSSLGLSPLAPSPALPRRTAWALGMSFPSDPRCNK
jgi:DDE superfamily endonuclease